MMFTNHSKHDCCEAAKGKLNFLEFYTVYIAEVRNKVISELVIILYKDEA